MTRTIPPSEVRKRAIVAGICATLLGAFIVSAFIRACKGDDFWENARRIYYGDPKPGAEPER